LFLLNLELPLLHIKLLLLGLDDTLQLLDVTGIPCKRRHHEKTRYAEDNGVKQAGGHGEFFHAE
jgi:hypothetical protein